MSDPIANTYGINNESNIYKRGSQRIYYILCTRGLTPFISHCGILPFYMITTSNYRGLFIYIDLALFLKYPFNQYVTNTDRFLRTNNPKCVHKYKNI